MSLLTDCTAEIIRLHKVLEVWTRGTVANTDQEFATFADVLDPGLTLINPDGEMESRDKIVKRFRSCHGARAGQGFSIEIADIAMLYDLEDRALVSYREHWLSHGERKSTILATALLGHRDGPPNKITWLHLHETWV